MLRVPQRHPKGVNGDLISIVNVITGFSLARKEKIRGGGMKKHPRNNIHTGVLRRGSPCRDSPLLDGVPVLLGMAQYSCHFWMMLNRSNHVMSETETSTNIHIQITAAF